MRRACGRNGQGWPARADRLESADAPIPVALAACAALRRLAAHCLRAGAARLRAGLAEYAAIWGREGPRITAALEAASGLHFPAGPIDANVSGARPMMSL